MMILRYISSELIAIPATFIAWVFADFIALGIKKDGRLIWPLRWAATADNHATSKVAQVEQEAAVLRAGRK